MELKMKKIAFAVASAALLNLSAESCASSFSGAYAGASLGMSAMTGDAQTNNISSDLAADNVVLNNKINLGKKNFVFGVFGGYGIDFNSCFYVGPELYASFGSSKVKILNQSDNQVSSKVFVVNLNKKYTVGGKVRLGYTVSPKAMVFLGFGGEMNKYELKSENIATAVAQTGVDLVVKKSKNKFQFAPSVGMDMKLNQNIVIRGEYTYSMKTKLKIAPAYIEVATSKRVADIKVNPENHRFELKVAYQF